MPDDHPPTPVPVAGVAFLLAQLGAHASSLYAARVAELGLTPATTGIMRLVSMEPGLSQQALATRLGMKPSRLVVVLNDLEARDLLIRQRDPADRRNHRVTLTEPGRDLMRAIAEQAGEHERQLTRGLTDDQRAELLAQLQALAQQEELTPGVHPGYRRLD